MPIKVLLFQKINWTATASVMKPTRLLFDASPQVTIPNEIVKKLGVVEGDRCEVIGKDGDIFLCPVVVYPKSEMARIAKLVKEAEDEHKRVRQRLTKTSIKCSMFKDIGIDRL